MLGRRQRIAVAIAGVLLLAGCAGEPGAPEPSAPASSPPHSEEEIARGVSETYASYLEASDAVAADGGTDPGRVRPFLTEAAYEQEAEGFNYLRENDLRLEGRTTFDSLSIRRWDSETVEAYLCLDLSNSRITDAAGSDVTPTDRVLRQPFEVSFDAQEGYLIDRNAVWTGDNFC